jgi:hypothetical protein
MLIKVHQREVGGEVAQTMYTHMNKCINNFLKISK